MVLTKTYAPPEVDRKEIFRYARCPFAPEEALLDECLAELEGKISYRVCWREFPIARNGDVMDLGFMKVESKSLNKHFAACQSVVLFAATIGIGIDRLTARYSRTVPSKALFFHAIGAERVESVCDAFCRELKAEKAAAGLYTTLRFSPGYGDLPLSMQKDVFGALNCEKLIGLTLNDSLLMAPSKSVTALVGVSDRPCEDCY